MIKATGGNASLSTAVLLLVFNRPDKTERVFEAIRKARPSRLYVAGDGPRAHYRGDAQTVDRAREIATSIDWPCEVNTLFRDQNLGCKHAVSSAIDWFFGYEEQGIILEDDCLPHADFFPFCEQLLHRYRDEDRVSVVTGNNFQNGRHRGCASYYFSRYNHCWGWATWRDRWQRYQGDIPFWPQWRESEAWMAQVADPVERAYWTGIFDLVHEGRIDSWAYPWTASTWFDGGLTITPNVNLVSNIGFGPDSTHTASASSPLSALEAKAIGSLRHPKDVAQDFEADRYTFDHAFGGRNLRFPYSLLRMPRKFLSATYRVLFTVKN